MVVWVFLPISLSLVSLIGTWTVYGIAYNNHHVCSLTNWEFGNSCRGNYSTECCSVPTISSSGTNFPENSLFTGTINLGSFLYLEFCFLHHAHIMENNSVHSMLSKFALAFGVVAALGSFIAGNCNPGHVQLMHYLGAALSFLCVCFYLVLLTALTGKCTLTGYGKFLYPARIVSSGIQVVVTVCYTILFAQEDYFYQHLAAVFEWMLSANLEIFEMSYVVEFYYFSSSMISNLLARRDEEKPLMLS